MRSGKASEPPAAETDRQLQLRRSSVSPNVPPLAGFVGKFALFVATMEAGYAWLMVLGLINSALSLLYYLRVVAPMFVPPAGAPPEAPEPIAKAVAVVSAAGSIALGIGAFALLRDGAALTLST